MGIVRREKGCRRHGVRCVGSLATSALTFPAHKRLLKSRERHSSRGEFFLFPLSGVVQPTCPPPDAFSRKASGGHVLRGCSSRSPSAASRNPM
eukprot:6840348-Prymnesium_polylepis.1